MRKVSILIPCYNEEENIPSLYEAVKQLMDSHTDYAWEVLMVNDGSKDRTMQLIRQLREDDQRICYVDLSRNFGKEAALLAGFDHVTGDCMVIVDADQQDPLDIIPTMLQYWEEGYDDIYAKRNSRGKESWLRKHLSLQFYSLLQKMSNIDIIPNVGDFRLLDRKCIDELCRMRETERYTKGLYCWIGFKKKEIIIDRASRKHGKSGWGYGKLFGLAINGITSFSTVPLRISTCIGLVISIYAFCHLAYFLIKTMIFGDDVQGFPTLVILILFLGGVQLLSLGIIGEYIGRIYNESKHRPVYLVQEYAGCGKSMSNPDQTTPSN